MRLCPLWPSPYLLVVLKANWFWKNFFKIISEALGTDITPCPFIAIFGVPQQISLETDLMSFLKLENIKFSLTGLTGKFYTTWQPLSYFDNVATTPTTWLKYQYQLYCCIQILWFDTLIEKRWTNLGWEHVCFVYVSFFVVHLFFSFYMTVLKKIKWSQS